MSSLSIEESKDYQDEFQSSINKIIIEDYDYFDDVLRAIKVNYNKFAAKTLNEHSNIDLLRREGICFWLTSKYNNPEMLRMLLEYYEKNQLKGEFGSFEYSKSRFKLHQVLRDMAENSDPSEEILEILSMYLPKGNSSSKQDSNSLENSSNFDLNEMDETEEIQAANYILSQNLLNGNN